MTDEESKPWLILEVNLPLFGPAGKRIAKLDQSVRDALDSHLTSFSVPYRLAQRYCHYRPRYTHVIRRGFYAANIKDDLQTYQVVARLGMILPRRAGITFIHGGRR